MGRQVYDPVRWPPVTRRRWPRRAIEVVHVGSASRDLTTDDPRGWRLGGGVTYAALTTARLGLRTAALIGVDEAGASARRARPAPRGRGRPRRRARSPRRRSSTNQETPAGRIQVCHAVGEPLAVRDLSRGVAGGARPGRSCRSPARSTTTGRRPSRPTPTSTLGWQGFLRDLAAGRAGRATRPPGPSRCSGGPTSSGSAITTSRPGRASRRSTGLLHPAPTCS